MTDKKVEYVQHPKMKCLLCKNKIQDKENYLILTEYNEGEKFSEAYYHVKCFKDRFMAIDKEKQQAQMIMSKAQELFTRVGV